MSEPVGNVATPEQSADTDEVKPDEIKIKLVRSSLAELELQASQTLQKLENIKANKTEPQTDAAKSDAAAPARNYLPTAKLAPTEILDNLEQFVMDTQTDDDPEFPFPALDDVTHLMLVSQSIAAYMSNLNRHQLAKLATKLFQDTNRWLSQLFKIVDCFISYHGDSTESILRAVRLSIVSKFPSYLDEGVASLPKFAIYVADNSSPVGLQFACRQIGLPGSSIRKIPTLADEDKTSAQTTIDLVQLQQKINEDVAANCTPLFLVLDLGASICGNVDDVLKIQELCQQNKIWLHLRGHSLAALSMQPENRALKSLADSITLNLGSWMGVPSIPVILMHRPLPNFIPSVFESDPLSLQRLTAITLWCTLQAMGRDGILERMFMAFKSCQILNEVVSKIGGIKVLNKSSVPGANSGVLPANELVKQMVNYNILFKSSVPVVVFQFDGSSGESEADKQGTEDPKITSSYYDRLNSWLGQILQRDCVSIDIEIIEHADYGTCLRFCPLELGLGDTGPTLESLEYFINCLELQIDILRATVKHKIKFNQLVEKNEVLRLVELPEWAGLGGVMFHPEVWEQQLTDQAKTELNKLNTELVELLRATDNAFSLGESTDGLICVRFGMVTEDTDVEELLDLVIQAGRNIQANSKVLSDMSEIVRKGIEAVTQDLQREADEKIWQDGILRSVPIVGRMVNWLSPLSKETGVKGRSLNLTQGVVESTENIYKYHMQMSGTTQLHNNKNPPTPLVQTPIGHSRNESQSSATSNHNTVVVVNSTEAANTVTTPTNGTATPVVTAAVASESDAPPPVDVK